MQVYIIMGVSGVGKTSTGKRLANKLNLPFYDADDFHSEENIRKMETGRALTDEDRQEWLEKLSEKIQQWHQEKGAVLACSALKESYRQKLSGIPEEELTWIFLHAEYEVIFERMSSRKNHYFKPEMLRSQYEILEVPGEGIQVEVSASEEKITEEIMQNLKKEKRSEIGVIGLGVMGKSLALNLASKEITTSVFNRHVEDLEVDIAKKFAAENRSVYDFPWFDELEPFIDSLEKPRNILLMVNAGKPVDLVIESLLPFLEKDDLIIDGGNSWYKDTARREKELSEKGILFLGTGISGGEEGARKGPSLMPDGSQKAYERVGKYLEQIAAKDKNNKPCCTYIGPEGAGHFVKMIHNGIEYAEMQLIAEIYHYLRFHFDLGADSIASIFEDWNKEMQSFLLEISVEILRKKEGEEFLIDKILDAAEQKGTGGWSTNAALELGVPLDTITAAVMARNISGIKKFREEASEIYKLWKSRPMQSEGKLSSIFKAYRASSIINHSIGFDVLKVASETYEWELNLSEIARIWTNGCIIRSGLMEELVEYLKDKPQHLLLHQKVADEVGESRNFLSECTAGALKATFPVPVMSAALNYFLSFTSAQSPANMIQAQRDHFGAHTYERTDKPRGEHFHTDWNKET